MPFDLVAYRSALRMSPQDLTTDVGREIRFVESTTSTMDDARAGAAAGGAPGTVYVAGEQSAGRGRQGRTWLSAASTGLYATYHLRAASAADAPLYALAGALAAGDAILNTSGLATVLKWPNDVQHLGPDGPRKLCGVLAESRPAAVGGRDVFLGIGINVRAAPLPDELAALATSIEGAGAEPPTLEALLGALSRAIGRWAAAIEVDPAAALAAWRQRLATLGQRVRLATPGGIVEGEAVDVSAHGELVIRHSDGRVEAYAAGDVTTLRGN